MGRRLKSSIISTRVSSIETWRSIFFAGNALHYRTTSLDADAQCDEMQQNVSLRLPIDFAHKLVASIVDTA